MESVNALKEDGYVVVRGAVSPELTEKAINVIKNEVKITMELEEFTQYDFSQTWLTVLASVVDAHRSMFSDALAPASKPNQPKSIHVGVFKETETKTRQGKLDTVYLTTAFFRGSHQTDDQSKWTDVELKLEPGDAVLWRDKLARREWSGGSGTFLTATYDI